LSKTKNKIRIIQQSASSFAAGIIRSNMEYKSGVDQIVVDSYEVVFEAIYSVLPLLCISCEEIGVNSFVASIGSKPECVTNVDVVAAGCVSIGLTAVPSENDDKDVSTGIVVGVIVACLILMVLTGIGIYTVWKRAVKEEEQALKNKREEAAVADEAADTGAPEHGAAVEPTDVQIQ
jgi:hypothetical protein